MEPKAVFVTLNRQSTSRGFFTSTVIRKTSLLLRYTSLYVRPSVRPSVHPSVRSSVRPSQPSVHLSIPSTHSSLNFSLRTVRPSLHLSLTPFIHPRFHLSVLSLLRPSLFNLFVNIVLSLHQVLPYTHPGSSACCNILILFSRTPTRAAPPAVIA